MYGAHCLRKNCLYNKNINKLKRKKFDYKVIKLLLDVSQDQLKKGEDRQNFSRKHGHFSEV